MYKCKYRTGTGARGKETDSDRDRDKHVGGDSRMRIRRHTLHLLSTTKEATITYETKKGMASHVPQSPSAGSQLQDGGYEVG